MDAAYKEEPSPREQTHAATEQDGWLWRSLGKVEEYELRMIFGIFRFVFWRLPRLIYDEVIAWLPTVAKLIKVVGLFVIWSSCVGAPLVLSIYSLSYIGDILNQMWSVAWRAIIDIGAILNETWRWAWLVTAVLGSAWGITHIKRRTGLTFKDMARIIHGILNHLHGEAFGSVERRIAPKASRYTERAGSLLCS